MDEQLTEFCDLELTDEELGEVFGGTGLEMVACRQMDAASIM